MSRNPKPQLTLADVLREKITEKQTEIQTQFSDNGSKWCLLYLRYSTTDPCIMGRGGKDLW